MVAVLLAEACPAQDQQGAAPPVLWFRAEATNALNHPVYSAPNTDPTNTAFGQITSQANQPRMWQFSGFLRF